MESADSAFNNPCPSDYIQPFPPKQETRMSFSSAAHAKAIQLAKLSVEITTAAG